MQKSMQIVNFLLLVTSISAFNDRKILVFKFGENSHKNTHQLVQLQYRYREQNLRNLYSLPRDAKNKLITHANNTLNNGRWEPILAIDYMSYFHDGNRELFESKLHAHNRRMALLVIGQLLDQESNYSSVKYMNEIVNGLWMLLEESTWVYPAHLKIQGTHDYLPDPTLDAIDLNAGENSKLVAWVKLMLYDKFQEVSPVINKRIDYELRRRIFHPFLQNDQWFWEGFHSHSVNNWNIWINGNILKTATLNLQDAELFNQVANKTFYSVDFFLDSYGDDGGCNEGPAYWRQAGGRLVEYIYNVADLYQAKNYFKSINLIKSIGEYAFKLHIERNWFANFADSIPIIDYPPSILAKYGMLFDDDNMKHFAAYIYQLQNNSDFVSHYLIATKSDINEFWNFLELRHQIESFKPEVPLSDYYWLPDIEVLTTHSSNNVFLAAKFGNNHESHNHNDVGSFVLFQHGRPVLIDVGVGTYTEQTFNEHRYDLFYMQSNYHNCPTINGQQQKAGDNFTSNHVYFNASSDKENLVLVGDIAHTYPVETHVKSWVRTIHLNRITGRLLLEDNFKLNKFIQPHQLNFMVVKAMKYDKTEHGLLLHYDKVKINMNFDWKVFTLQAENKSLDNDRHLTQVWGESVQRISLVANYVNSLTSQFAVIFSP